MSIADEIVRLELAKQNIRTTIINKGVAVPEDAKLDQYANFINNITGGGSTGGIDETLYNIFFNKVTNNGTNFDRLFSDYTGVTLDVGALDVSRADRFWAMFEGSNNLTELLNISNWNVTSTLHNTAHMFKECNSLISLDLSNWDTSGLQDIQEMFYNCTSLQYLNLSTWNTSNVNNVRNMFYGVPSTCEIILGPNWTFDEEETGFTGKFIGGPLKEKYYLLTGWDAFGLYEIKMKENDWDPKIRINTIADACQSQYESYEFDHLYGGKVVAKLRGYDTKPHMLDAFNNFELTKVSPSFDMKQVFPIDGKRFITTDDEDSERGVFLRHVDDGHMIMKIAEDFMSNQNAHMDTRQSGGFSNKYNTLLIPDYDHIHLLTINEEDGNIISVDDTNLGEYTYSAIAAGENYGYIHRGNNDNHMIVNFNTKEISEITCPRDFTPADTCRVDVFEYNNKNYASLLSDWGQLWIYCIEDNEYFRIAEREEIGGTTKAGTGYIGKGRVACFRQDREKLKMVVGYIDDHGKTAKYHEEREWDDELMEDVEYSTELPYRDLLMRIIKVMS